MGGGCHDALKIYHVQCIYHNRFQPPSHNILRKKNQKLSKVEVFQNPFSCILESLNKSYQKTGAWLLCIGILKLLFLTTQLYTPDLTATSISQ